MSLRPQPIGSIPEQTARVAHAAFPKGPPSLTLRDHLGTIFQDEDFAALFPAWGSPGLPPWRLALVTIMQFREQLSDRQAAEAVRARIAWKYLLGLDLTDPGFDFSVLCEFRDRWDQAEMRNTVVYGVNPQSPDSHKKFRSKYKFQFPLLVDTGQKVGEQYHTNGLFVKRTVYLIGQDGVIRYAKRGKPAPEEVLAAAN